MNYEEQIAQERNFIRKQRKWAIEQAIKGGAQGAYQILNDARELLNAVFLVEEPIKPE